jgi:NRAMP (natural resistance-associated macrophage protein)-like metal ion transporter
MTATTHSADSVPTPAGLSGARYGYLLLWVVLAANLMAMLVQYLSAKLGIITGQSLPEHVRRRFPRPVTWGMPSTS